MCLSIIQRKPYNETKTRWKTFVATADGKILSPFQNGNKWVVGEIKNATNQRYGNNEDVGFHVFLTKADAARTAKKVKEGWLSEPKSYAVTALVEVDKFNAAGEWDYYMPALKSETWRRCKILQVFTAAGRTDITSRFSWPKTG